jgi:hypothetical protein
MSNDKPKPPAASPRPVKPEAAMPAAGRWSVFECMPFGQDKETGRNLLLMAVGSATFLCADFETGDVLVKPFAGVRVDTSRIVSDDPPEDAENDERPDTN